MKRKISVFLIMFVMFFSIKVSGAENVNINASINGNIEKGKEIEILINIEEISSLYAASFYYKYDPTILKIKEIVPGELISKSGINKFEATKIIDAEKGMVTYAFTCMGNIKGFSGKGNFIKLKAEILSEKAFKITSSFNNKTPNDEYTVRMQICDSDIVELPYNFKGVSFTLNDGDGVVTEDDSPSDTSGGDKTNTPEGDNTNKSGGDSGNTSKNDDSNKSGGDNSNSSNSSSGNSPKDGGNNTQNTNNAAKDSNKTTTENGSLNKDTNKNIEKSKAKDSNGHSNRMQEVAERTEGYKESQEVSKLLLYVLMGFGAVSLVVVGTKFVRKVYKKKK